MEFLRQFSNINTSEAMHLLSDPSARSTFEQSRLDLSERTKNSGIYDLHRDLIHLKREDPVFRETCACRLEGAVLGPQAFLLRYFHADDQRVLLINFGCALRLCPAPEPLLAPPENCRWEILWSSETTKYGGAGITKPETGDYWRVPGQAALVLIPKNLGVHHD
jgi:maltooligosyltrehalose trehalohydrolase